MIDASLPDPPPLVIGSVLGSRLDAGIVERLHRLEHHHAVDALILAAPDLARRRLRARTQGGLEVAIALSRDQRLFDGAVLLLEDARALVVRVEGERWLRLRPRSGSAAIELGYHAGNLHWRVRFDEGSLLVALEGPIDAYLDRLRSLVADDRVIVEPAVDGRSL